MKAIQGPATKDGLQPTDTPGAAAQEPSEDSTAQSRQEGAGAPGDAQAQSTQDPRTADTQSAAFKNAQTLRYLLSVLPASITGFFHNLGLGLVGKRRTDPYLRQKPNANMVADAIAETVFRQMQFNPANSSDSLKHRFAYLIVILSSFSQLLYEGK